jgi:hypothetical protein
LFVLTPVVWARLPDRASERQPETPSAIGGVTASDSDTSQHPLIGFAYGGNRTLALTPMGSYRVLGACPELSSQGGFYRLEPTRADTLVYLVHTTRSQALESIVEREFLAFNRR